MAPSVVQGIQYEINYYEQECKMEHLRSKFSYHSVGE